MEITSDKRAFLVDKPYLKLLDNGNHPVSLYPYGIERLFLEKGIKPRQIWRAMPIPYLHWDNRVQISEGVVEFEEKSRKVPGLLIRYADNVNFEEKDPTRGLLEEGKSPYMEGLRWTNYLARHVLDIRDTTYLEIGSSGYFAFNARNHMQVLPDALEIDPDASALEIEVKRQFQKFLTTEEGIIFELLTNEGLLQHPPDFILLEGALNQGIRVGISQYKLTFLALANFVYQQLRQSDGELRVQFEEAERRFEKNHIYRLLNSFTKIVLFFHKLGLRRHA